jgi:hypothetical protein
LLSRAASSGRPLQDSIDGASAPLCAEAVVMVLPPQTVDAAVLQQNSEIVRAEALGGEIHWVQLEGCKRSGLWGIIFSIQRGSLDSYIDTKNAFLSVHSAAPQSPIT